ncbi:MAG: radical SAM protein [Candidatus Alcyoniella australis]|nr:radical SAM protein [Candidatus Alcyoniella australis]
MSGFDLQRALERALTDLEPLTRREPGLQRLARELQREERPLDQRKRLLRLAGIVTDRAYVGPTIVHLDVVGVCNLNCIYCRDHSPYLVGRESWRSMEMPLERIKLAVEQGIEIGVERFSMAGAGEPRMHSRFAQIIEYMIERDVEFEIFTNGTLLSEDDLQLLSRAQRLKLYFSISAASERTYKAFRPELGGELLPRIERAISRLAQLRGDAAGPRSVIVHVLCSMNVHELMQFGEQALRTGADELQLKLCEYEPYNQSIMLDRDQLDRVRDALPQLKAELAAHGVTVHDNIDYQLEQIDAETGLFSRELYRQIGCYIGFDLVRVRRDGRIAFCCGLKWVGELERDGLAAHFFGPQMDRLRHAAKRSFVGCNATLPNGDPLLAADCHRCYNYITNRHLQRDLERLDLWEPIVRLVRSDDCGCVAQSATQTAVNRGAE